MLCATENYSKNFSEPSEQRATAHYIIRSTGGKIDGFGDEVYIARFMIFFGFIEVISDLLKLLKRLRIIRKMFLIIIKRVDKPYRRSSTAIVAEIRVRMNKYNFN